MQRVTNCVLQKNGKVLLLQKPRRGWWVAPGGKMETGESVKEAVTREYREETGLILNFPMLKGVFTFILKEKQKVISEWMMFTFYAESYQGKMLEKSEEGILQWMNTENIASLPMAEGDIYFLNHACHGKDIMYGTFTYSSDDTLLNYKLDGYQP